MQTPLERARLAKGVSKSEVARNCCIDKGHYGRIETGERIPSAEVANAIAKYFGNAVTRDQVLFPKDYAASPVAEQVA